MRKLLNKLDVWLARRTKCYRSLEKTFHKEREKHMDFVSRKEIFKLNRLYLGGLQRDFAKELTPSEKKLRASACITFVKSACEPVFNEILKDYSESLFNLGETEEARNFLHNNINVVLKVEKKIRDYAHVDKPDEDFDSNEPL